MPCPLCGNEHRITPPDGPEDARVALIGEALGLDEDRHNANFIGKTGRELNEHYLPLAGLRRDSVRVLNTVPFLPCTPKHKLDMSRNDHKALADYGAMWLYPDLGCNHYSLLVPMGAVACRAIDPAIDLEMQHGIPLDTDWGKVLPMYHPAGGIHEPKKMLHIRTDWYRLKQYLHGSLRVAKDEYSNPNYQEIETPQQLSNYLWLGDMPLACDTETTRQRDPFCITLSVCPGSGRLIRATNLPVLEALQDYLNGWDAPILFHNWLFDKEVVEKMGLSFPHRRIIDTMVKCFHLGNLPQGLKALAYRELGMRMQDFDDLVTPYAKPRVLEYYANARCEEWGKPEEQLLRDTEKPGGYRLYKPQSFSTKIKRFWTAYDKNPEIDVFKPWQDNWAEHHEEVQAKLGPWPGKCISYVPFEDALYYACRDADATLRLWPILRGMERKVRRTTQERWRDHD